MIAGAPGQSECDPMPDAIVDFLVRKDDLRETRWRMSTVDALSPGEIRVRIDRFAFTANNVSYALFGERMGYWDLYPAAEGFGRPPVWGFGTIEESRARGLQAGERLYGLWPMSSHAVLRPGVVAKAGFSEVSPWRTGRAAPYNRYLRIDDDPEFAADAEAVQAVFRPLFSTSFLLADFLDENASFGAEAVVLSSASSKTALGLGRLLKSAEAGPHVVGLTSPRNADFVRDTGYFDAVLTYDEVGALPRRPTVSVDMAGGATLRRAVHEHLAEALTYSCAVGGTHWEDPGRAAGLPGPRPTLFFAPARSEKRRADWGPEGFAQRYAAAWRDFLGSAAGWIQPQHFTGCEAVEALYCQVLEGELPPAAAPMGSLPV